MIELYDESSQTLPDEIKSKIKSLREEFDVDFLKDDIKDLDLEHINCLDINLFNQNLFDLINGEEVTLPKYNFKTGKREQGKTL